MKELLSFLAVFSIAINLSHSAAILSQHDQMDNREVEELLHVLDIKDEVNIRDKRDINSESMYTHYGNGFGLNRPFKLMPPYINLQCNFEVSL